MNPNVPQPVFLNVEYLFFWIYQSIVKLFGGTIDSNAFGRIFGFIKGVITILLVCAIAWLLYSLVRLYEINQEGKPKKERMKESKKESKKKEDLSSNKEAGQAEEGVGGSYVPPPVYIQNDTWEAVRTKLLSDNPSDWRLAIIEADIYLDKVLDQKGFYGDTLGDKFKQITPDKLPSIQIAWEAHKVRNRIAHEGADFFLPMPEARKVLSYYETVFRDLGVIS